MNAVIDKVVRTACQTLDMDVPEIYYEEAGRFPSPDITSVMHPRTLTVHVNRDWMTRAEPLEVIFTVLHEVRHVYQKRLVSEDTHDDDGVSGRDLRQWKKEFEAYTKPSRENAGKRDDDYTMQSIEIDAMAFAAFMIQGLFGYDYPIPDELADDVRERLIHMQHYRIAT